MPYKFCKCETERLNKTIKASKPEKEVAPIKEVEKPASKCPYCVEPCGNEWCAWRKE
jgi:redox-regulated HSP33 family molecular chaperone